MLGLIPVEAPPYPGHSPVSPAPPNTESIHPAPVPEQETGICTSTTSEKPAMQGDYDAPTFVNPGAESSTKAYPGQPHPDQSQVGHGGQYPMNAPSDAKAYPGQPVPEQMHPPQVYYTPYGHPSGYATATPLHALQSAPCPVDCPVCGQREMTRVQAVSGSTTQ